MAKVITLSVGRKTDSTPSNTSTPSPVKPEINRARSCPTWLFTHEVAMKSNFPTIDAVINFGDDHLVMRTDRYRFAGFVETDFIEIAYLEYSHPETGEDGVERKVFNTVSTEYYLADNSDHRARAMQAFAHRALHCSHRTSPFAEPIDQFVIRNQDRG
jgi:hypothetical protein